MVTKNRVRVCMHEQLGMIVTMEPCRSGNIYGLLSRFQKKIDSMSYQNHTIINLLKFIEVLLVYMALNRYTIKIFMMNLSKKY